MTFLLIGIDLDLGIGAPASTIKAWTGFVRYCQNVANVIDPSTRLCIRVHRLFDKKKTTLRRNATFATVLTRDFGTVCRAHQP